MSDTHKASSICTECVSQGFPNIMAVTTDNGMPSSFCGVSCGAADGFSCTAAFWAQWNQYLTALQNYLSAKGLLAKSYWYTQNEPQVRSGLCYGGAMIASRE